MRQPEFVVILKIELVRSEYDHERPRIIPSDMPSLATIDEHVTIARTYADEIWNQGVLSHIDDIASDEIICHGTSVGDLEGPDELKEFVAVARAAFPGLTYHVVDVSLDTDVIELHWSATDDVQPERPIDHMPISGRTALRITDGEIAEMRSSFDPWVF